MSSADMNLTPGGSERSADFYSSGGRAYKYPSDRPQYTIGGSSIPYSSLGRSSMNREFEDIRNREVRDRAESIRGWMDMWMNDDVVADNEDQNVDYRDSNGNLQNLYDDTLKELNGVQELLEVGRQETRDPKIKALYTVALDDVKKEIEKLKKIGAGGVLYNNIVGGQHIARSEIIPRWSRNYVEYVVGDGLNNNVGTAVDEPPSVLAKDKNKQEIEERESPLFKIMRKHKEVLKDARINVLSKGGLSSRDISILGGMTKAQREKMERENVRSVDEGKIKHARIMREKEPIVSVSRMHRNAPPLAQEPIVSRGRNHPPLGSGS